MGNIFEKSNLFVEEAFSSVIICFPLNLVKKFYHAFKKEIPDFKRKSGGKSSHRFLILKIVNSYKHMPNFMDKYIPVNH